MALGAPSGTGRGGEEARVVPTGHPQSWTGRPPPVCGARWLRKKRAPARRRRSAAVDSLWACAEGTAPAPWGVLQPRRGRVLRQGGPTSTHQAGGEASVDLRNQGLDAAGCQLRQDLLCGQRGS